MVKNVIFDMGNVLIKYDPAYFIERENIASEADRALLMEAVFRAPEWPMQDSGAIDEPEMEAAALKRLPERLHAVAHRLIWAWNEPVEPIPGMAELIRDCKARGLGVYLLSNASRRQREYWPTIPGSECFDGGVVSAFERQIKPGPEIYRTLLERYRLDPAECVFVDDIQRNVDGALAVGMGGILFTGDAQALREALFG